MNYGKFKSCLNIGCLIFCCSVFFTIQGCIKEAKIVEYDELKSWFENNEYMVLIDVRSSANFNSGHLQNAINIDLSTFVNTDGTLINSGEALTTVVADKGKKIVVYCFGNGNDKIFADAALGLRYTNVYRYVGGTADWSEHGDYYVIEYAGFKAWYDAQYPFDNEENYLIDDRPVTWYTGDDYAHPDGHIPGALNIPLESWVNSYGGLVNNGKTFADVITNKESTVVIYCGNASCDKSLMGARAAVAIGYTHVYRYQEGLQEWKDEGNALKTGDQP